LIDSTAVNVIVHVSVVMAVVYHSKFSVLMTASVTPIISVVVFVFVAIFDFVGFVAMVAVMPAPVSIVSRGDRVFGLVLAIT
jgi:hypothetical protein